MVFIFFNLCYNLFMNSRILYIISLLFLISVVIMPLTLANCGMANFYLTLGCHTSLSVNSCGGINFDHLNLMRGMLIFGLSAIFYFFLAVVFKRKILFLTEIIKKEFFIKFKLLLNLGAGLGQLKPFDNLLLAYSSGLIQPKSF